MKVVSFPSTLDRIEGYGLADKNALLRFDKDHSGGRHSVAHGHDGLHDDCLGGVYVESFQKGLQKSPSCLSPFFFLKHMVPKGSLFMFPKQIGRPLFNCAAQQVR
jgi:hypothetical protein